MNGEQPDLELLLAQTGWIQGLARRLVGDPHAADDLTQETLVKALEEPPRETADVRVLRAWLGRVVRSRVAMRLRGEGRRAARERGLAVSAPGGEVSEEDRTVERAAQSRLVVRVVGELAEPYRSTVLLRYYEGLSAADIARETGTSHATVRKRLSRAMEMLRERLDEEHGGDRRAWCIALTSWLEGNDPTPAAAVLGTAGTLGGIAMTLKALGVVAALAVLSLSIFFDADPEAPTPAREGPVTETVAAPEPDSRASEPAEPREAVSGHPARTAAARPAPRAPEGTEVRGLVTDGRGAGIAGAEISLRDVARDTVLATATTDAEGAYTIVQRLSSPAATTPPREPILWTRIEATGVGFLMARSANFDALLADSHRIDLQLERGHEWIGRVVDDLGHPVAARVTVHVPGTEGVQRTVSSRDGTYRVPLSIAPQVWITSSRTEVGFGFLGPITPPAGEDYHVPDLVLESLGVMEGVLLYPDGRPVADAVVRAYPVDHELERAPTPGGWWENPPRPNRAEPFWELGGLPWGGSATNEAGEFVIAGLVPGRYELVTESAEVVRHGVFRTGDWARLFDERYVVRVRVVDDTGHALRGPRVLLVCERGGQVWSTSFQAQVPDFEVVVFPGSWRVVAGDHGASPYFGELEVTEGGYRYEVEVVLDHRSESGRFELALRDPNGELVDDLEAALVPRTFLPREPLLEYGYDLAFAFGTGSGEVPAGAYRLEIAGEDRSGGFRLAASEDVDVGAGENPVLELAATYGARLRIRLGGADELGTTRTARAELRAWAADAQPRSVSVLGAEPGRLEHLVPADGEPHLSTLFAPGSYTLRVEAEGFEPVERDVLLRASEILDVDVDLSSR